MRVLHVSPWFPPAWSFGGIVTSVGALAEAQVRAGAEVTVLTTDADGAGRVDSPPLERRNGVRVRTFRVAWPHRLFRAPGLLASLPAELQDADVVHVHGLFHSPGLAAARSASPEKLVVSPRGMLVKELIRARSRLAKSAWLAAFPHRNVRLWMASSGRERRDVLEFDVSSERVRVVPNGVLVPEGHRDPSPEVRELLAAGDYALYLGRMSWKKGLGDLLDAWRPHAKRLRLVVCGPDEDGIGQRLMRDESEWIAAGRLILWPGVAPHDAHALLAGAELLALFSRHENFGNVVLEAMAHGTPVVVHDTVGASEWVERAGAGWVVRPGEAADGLSAALRDPEERRRRGQRGRELARGLSWDRIALQTLDAYAEIRA